MAGLKLKNIKKIYSNGFYAVKNLCLDIEDKEFVVLVGPSGCGKSTSLRMIAGLEDITSGELYIGDKLVNDIEPKDRDIAMVFQNYALYPHMTIYENMAFALKLRKKSKDEIRQKVLDVAKALGIENLLDRKPKQLSGGQKQRVALGRAIVREPKVFLMDEPLSNLDVKLRLQMRAEISKLHHRLQTTFIYVTHDQVEAMTMGTKIVVMKSGIVQQVSDPQTIYNKPANIFVASFIGSPQMNFIRCNIKEENFKLYAMFKNIKIELIEKHCTILRRNNVINKNVILGVRPQDIHISTEYEENINAKIEVKEMLGSETYLYLNMEGINLIIRVEANFDASIGTYVKIAFNKAKIHFFNEETEENII